MSESGHHRIPVFVVVGPPGAGKSTALRALIRDAQGVSHFAVRSYFNQQIADGTALGNRARELRLHHRWLPTEIIIEALDAWLGGNANSCSAIVIEGFPWDRTQALELDRVLARRGLAVAAVVFFDVPDDVVLTRTSERRVCTNCETSAGESVLAGDGKCNVCGRSVVVRPDDNPEVLGVRLRHFREAVKGILEHYGEPDIVCRIDGRQPQADTERFLARAIAPMTGAV